MKKKNLILALAALAAAADASALTRSFEGTGEAVLLPYYSAAGGEATLFGVANHSDQPKAVRVVIAEGRNGRPALTFNVYLAARDSWNGAIALSVDGTPPRLFSSEESCTVPSISPEGVALRNFGYTGSRADGLGTDVERMQHGSIELIEVGVPTGVPAQQVAARDCAGLILRFNSGAWELTPNADMAAPSGGLTGEAQIVDVAGGVAYGSNPVVLDDFSFAPRHGSPGPQYNAVRFYKPTASPTVGGFIVGDAQVPIDRAADAVGLLLMSTAFEAGYLLGGALDARTRIAVALPTRPAYLDDLPGGELPAGTAAAAPFADATANAPYCVDSDWQAIDRTGESGAVATLPLCGQVNVVDLGQQAGAGVDFATGSDAGRVRIDLQGEDRELPYDIPGGIEPIHFARGLPAVVQSLTEVRNANAQPGVLASYAVSHRVLRETDYDAEF